nr:hypothetical protein CFP56_12036 [Quercus suber]
MMEDCACHVCRTCHAVVPMEPVFAMVPTIPAKAYDVRCGIDTTSKTSTVRTKTLQALRGQGGRDKHFRRDKYHGMSIMTGTAGIRKITGMTGMTGTIGIAGMTCNQRCQRATATALRHAEKRRGLRDRNQAGIPYRENHRQYLRNNGLSVRQGESFRAMHMFGSGPMVEDKLPADHLTVCTRSEEFSRIKYILKWWLAPPAWISTYIKARQVFREVVYAKKNLLPHKLSDPGIMSAKSHKDQSLLLIAD